MTGQHRSSSFTSVMFRSLTLTDKHDCARSVFTALLSWGWCLLQRWQWSWCRWPWSSRRRRQVGSRWLWWWWAGPGSQGLQSPTCFSSSEPLLTRVKIWEEWVIWARDLNPQLHRQGTMPVRGLTSLVKRHPVEFLFCFSFVFLVHRHNTHTCNSWRQKCSNTWSNAPTEEDC